MEFLIENVSVGGNRSSWIEGASSALWAKSGRKGKRFPMKDARVLSSGRVRFLMEKQ